MNWRKYSNFVLIEILSKNAFELAKVIVWGFSEICRLFKFKLTVNITFPLSNSENASQTCLGDPSRNVSPVSEYPIALILLLSSTNTALRG
jgi:hypothetical protein